MINSHVEMLAKSFLPKLLLAMVFQLSNNNLRQSPSCKLQSQGAKASPDAVIRLLCVGKPQMGLIQNRSWSSPLELIQEVWGPRDPQEVPRWLR